MLIRGLFLPALTLAFASSQTPPPAAAPAQDPGAVPVPVAGQPAPELSAESWRAGKDPAGGVVRKVTGSGGMPSQDELEKRMQALRGDPTLAKLHGAILLVHRTPIAEAARWNELLELVDANRDRGALLVSLVVASDAEPAAHRLESEELSGPIGILGERAVAPYAPGVLTVIGPSGEVLACSTKPGEIQAAFEEALSRPSALAIEHPLAPALLPALNDYWNGRYAAARDAAERVAKKLEHAEGEADQRVAEDARYLAKRVDAQEQELVAQAASARTESAIEKLVDLDQVFERGFHGAVAKTADEYIKGFVAQSLFSARMYDYKKYLEIVDKRPLYFPRRDDAAAKRIVKQLEALLKSSSNDATTQQRSRALIERYKKRHG